MKVIFRNVHPIAIKVSKDVTDLKTDEYPTWPTGIFNVSSCTDTINTQHKSFSDQCEMSPLTVIEIVMDVWKIENTNNNKCLFQLFRFNKEVQ